LGTPYTPGRSQRAKFEAIAHGLVDFTRSRRSSGRSAITASWIAASIINMLSSGFSAHSHHRSKERRANFKRVLFQRQFTDKLHDAIFDDIGFNADP
jgi:hypothetical protein